MSNETNATLSCTEGEIHHLLMLK